MEDELQALAERLRPIFAEFGIQKAIVFGSLARGEASRRSDLDLIVLWETEQRFLDRYDVVLRILLAAYQGRRWTEGCRSEVAGGQPAAGRTSGSGTARGPGSRAMTGRVKRVAGMALVGLLAWSSGSLGEELVAEGRLSPGEAAEAAESGVRLEIAADLRVVSGSRPIQVTVTAVNESRERVVWGQGSSSCQLELWVEMEGAEYRGDAGRICTADYGDQGLEPGGVRREVFEWAGEVLRGGAVERLEPGVYRLRGGAGEFRSEPLEVEVRGR